MIKKQLARPKIMSDAFSKNYGSVGYQKGEDVGFHINGKAVSHSEFMRNKYGSAPGDYDTDLEEEEKEFMVGNRDSYSRKAPYKWKK